MFRCRPSHVFGRSHLVAPLVAIGLVAYADLPADAAHSPCFSRSLFVGSTGPASELVEDDGPGATLRTPVSLRVRSEANHGSGSGAIAVTDTRAIVRGGTFAAGVDVRPDVSLHGVPVLLAQIGNSHNDVESGPVVSCGKDRGSDDASADGSSTPRAKAAGSAEVASAVPVPSQIGAAARLLWRNPPTIARPHMGAASLPVRPIEKGSQGLRVAPAPGAERGLLAQVAAEMASLRLAPNGRGPTGPSVVGGNPGNEYSFVVLFVLGADGLWRVWWF
jgi:hypothetical protein